MLVSPSPRWLSYWGSLPVVTAVSAQLLLGCNSLWGIGDLRYESAAGGNATASGIGGAGGAGGVGAGGSAGGTPQGGGGGGGHGGSGCTFGPFHSPEPLVGFDTTYTAWDPAVSADELTLWWGGERPGTLGQGDLWFSVRPAIGAPFGSTENAGAINTASAEGDPELSADGLTLYWVSDRTGGVGDFDIWYATRTSVVASFGAEDNASLLNTTASERDPALSADGHTLYFVSDRVGGTGEHDIWYASRSDLSAPFDDPQLLPGVNTVDGDDNPAVSPDGLTLYFASNRVGGAGSADIWYATRPDEDSDFGSPQPLTAANSTSVDSDPTLSADGRTLYFATTRGAHTSGRLWTVVRQCE